jgi:hypothetical protein
MPTHDTVSLVDKFSAVDFLLENARQAARVSNADTDTTTTEQNNNGTEHTLLVAITALFFVVLAEPSCKASFLPVALQVVPLPTYLQQRHHWKWYTPTDVGSRPGITMFCVTLVTLALGTIRRFVVFDGW